MSSFRHDRSKDGLDRIQLQNRHVDVTVVPAAGGKIIDLIGCEWSVDELQVTAVGDVVCDMSAIGGSAPYRFKRQIRLRHDEPIVYLSYSLTNDGDESLPCYWRAHPLLAVEPATTPYDCVNQAIENDAVPWLQPGGIRNWSLSVELQA